MKKSVLLIGPFLFSLALQGGVKSLLISEKPITKTIQFAVFTEADYTRAAYNQSKGKVQLSIWKYNSSEPELVWCDSINAGKLKNYPTEENSLFREVTLHNIKDSKDILVAGYKVIYESKGSKLSYDEGQLVEKGTTPGQVKIKI